MFISDGILRNPVFATNNFAALPLAECLPREQSATCVRCAAAVQDFFAMSLPGLRTVFAQIHSHANGVMTTFFYIYLFMYV